MPLAVITGASQGLGLATARALSTRGWTLIVDARDESRLAAATRGLPGTLALAGDVTDPAHRARLAAAVASPGGLDLLMNNASRLGPSPQPPLLGYPPDELAEVYQTNVLAPLALIQALAGPLAEAGGAIVNVSSDAAVEHYPGWGGYGSSKAALDHLTGTLAVERPSLDIYAFDPGDMRTDMHARAEPGEDISGLPEPETVVPALLRLLDERPASGRYTAAALTAGAAAVASPASPDRPALAGPSGLTQQGRAS